MVKINEYFVNILFLIEYIIVILNIIYEFFVIYHLDIKKILYII